MDKTIIRNVSKNIAFTYSISDVVTFYLTNLVQHSDYASSLGYLRNVVQGQHLSQPIKHTSFVLIDQSNRNGEILNSGDVTRYFYQ